MPYNYSKLKGRIVEKFGTQAALAKEIGWSERTLSLKLTGKTAFSQDDIEKMLQLLGLGHKDIQAYFFVVKAQ